MIVFAVEFLLMVLQLYLNLLSFSLEASVRVKSFYPFLILSFHSWHFDSSRPYHGIKVLWWWII